MCSFCLCWYSEFFVLVDCVVWLQPICLPVLQQVVITMHSDDLESLSKHEKDFFDQFDAVSPVGTVAPAQLGEEQTNGRNSGGII